MIETGDYQNTIPSLSALSVKDYERIFKVFKASVDDKDFFYYNILKKIDFPVIDSQYIGYYDVRTRMPMTTISWNIYGDIKSWWILYLLNRDKFDGAPFYVEGGVQLAYITDALRGLIYSDITQGTVFGGRHF
jgi:hypothetical protein